MQFTTGTLTACSGGEHLTIPITIGAKTRNMQFTKAEFIDAGPDDHGELRAAIIARLRSAALESVAGVPTPLQVRTAVSGKTFKV